MTVAHERPSTQVMGIVNLTPDSFSDGGQLSSPDQVWKHIQPWIDAGIHWIDLGAESTRPGAHPVTQAQEWQRLEPLLEFLHHKNIQTAISIDSRHPSTQLQALDIHAVQMINCVDGSQSMNQNHLRALRAKRPSLHYMAMHMHGEPTTMQHHPLNAITSISVVTKFFKQATQSLKESGFDHQHIWLDPGIGFGKTRQACWQLIKMADQFRHHYPLCYGISRKSFLVHQRQNWTTQELDELSFAVTKQLTSTDSSSQNPLIIRTHHPLMILDSPVKNTHKQHL